MYTFQFISIVVGVFPLVFILRGALSGAETITKSKKIEGE